MHIGLSNFSKSLILFTRQIILLFALFLPPVKSNLQAQVSSTSAGDTWSAASARETGVVPTNTPDATKSGPASPTICIGSSVTLTANATEDPEFTYSWTSSPPGFTASTRIVTVSPISTTNYTVIITDGNGLIATENARVTVNPNITPTFAAIPAICSGAAPPILPATSIDGITGSWAPAFNNAATTTYTFTPTAGECATTVTLTVTVNPNTTPTFNPLAGICTGTAAPVLPTTSTNGISGTWSPAAVSNTATDTYTFTPVGGQCATTPTLTITVNPITIPTFTAIPAICSGTTAPLLPTNSTNGISGTWSPAIVSNATTATYLFSPVAGQCAASAALTVTVNPKTTPLFNPVAAICSGTAVPVLPTTSNNGISGTWSPATVSNTATGTYIFTPTSGQCATPAALTVTVNPNIIPTFAAIPAICSGAAAPILPLTSIEGITGSWAPAFNNTATTIYTFTPNTGQCATTATLTVIINPNNAPIFNPVAAICNGETASVLPTTSTNGISGTWSPEVVSNTTTGTYTFTPSAGQCALTVALTVTVNPNITPTFSQIGPLCHNSTPPVLPKSSINLPAITGTWSPATINTATVGTTTYTFTPAAGQCARTTTMDIITATQISPTFDVIGPFCQNSTGMMLPGSSTNTPAMTGTWNPATISTATVGTTTYTFNPDAGQCASTASLDIVIATQVTPTFAPIGPLCQNSTAPPLPVNSDNIPAISGTWSPAVISTATLGTTTYIFTPTGSSCATSATLNITTAPQITPTLAAIGPLCQNSTAPLLPVRSTNTPAITGTWSPATIGTATTGTTTYTFTPASGQCASTTSIDITIATQITPTFSAIGPFCENSTAPLLPPVSNNTPAITGIWSPTTISTATAGTTTYTFTPTESSCTATTTLDIVTTAQTTPAFAAIGPLCQNSIAPVLPASSTNTPAITGTWSPATVSTSTLGTTTYNFTPAAGQCALKTSIDITIATQVNPNFAAIGPLCQNSTAPSLPGNSDNIPAISGTWSPAVISTATLGTTTYIFTTTGSSCATSATLNITIAPQITPTFAAIGPLCQNSTAPSLPVNSNNIPAVSGTWSPATISTATAGITTYTFTPTGSPCATTATLDIETTAQITPIFTTIGPLCQNSTSPLLPLSSSNEPAITGTWSPASVSTANVGTTTYTFKPDAGQCASTASLDIVIATKITPTFEAIGPLCRNSTASLLPVNSTNSPAITGTWSPATISTAAAGTTTYTFSPTGSSCATITTLNIITTVPIMPSFDAIGPLCRNSPSPSLPVSSTNTPAITGKWSPATISTATVGTTTYTFTPAAGQCAATASIDITIAPQITPTFAAMGPLCQYGTAPLLPLSSTNSPAITGTWSPEMISTATTGTTTYTFIPAAGQCVTTAILTVIVKSNITPTFDAMPAICSGAAAPVLPATSIDGITGSWAPAFNNTATTTYTFTPSAGQCASTSDLTITVNPITTPTFNPVAEICNGSPAPVLPTTSKNGITGTWNPATVNNTATGTYTFTPSAIGCATTATVTVIVDPNTSPAFSQIGPLCQYGTVPPLPITSDNGIPGTWNPATISNTVTGTTSYVFTPSIGCEVPLTMDIVITNQIVPSFTPIGPLCQGSVAPVLPAVSNNGIRGTWIPATVSNTLTTSYTFTPTAGQCETTATLTIAVNPNITPTFAAIPAICSGATPPMLPTTSIDGITGSWAPAFNNNATTTYTFTPTAGQCATTVNLTVTVNPNNTPIFNPVTSICSGAPSPVLPTTSINGFSGTWSPATVSNTTTGAYNFTPSPGQCATTATLTVTINPNTIPIFSQIDPLCQNSTAPVLLTSSTNIPAITGTWSPATILTTILGTTTYTFTPVAGQCPATATLDITTTARITPTFTPVGKIYQNSVPPVLPVASSTGISGTWSPAIISTATVGKTNYTFTPSNGQCASTATLVIAVEMLVVISSEVSLTDIGPCEHIKLDASKSVGDIVKYEWSVNNHGGLLIQQTGDTNEFYLSPTYPGSLPADFYVKLVVTNSQGATQSDSITIRVDSYPVAEISSTGKLETDGSMIVDAIVSYGSIRDYRWFTSEGKIIGPNNLPTAKLYGAGIYTLEITDNYGCTITKNFIFPVEIYQIIANPDYARITWANDTTIKVLGNDQSPGVGFLSGSERILEQPTRGSASVNTDGSITYIPNLRQTGYDQFVYEVCNVMNLCASATVTIDIYDIGIIIPGGFSPNGDGINDQYVLGGLENYPQSQLYIYTRSGLLVYQSSDYQNDWNGATVQSTQTIKKVVPTGVYYYVLKLGGTNRLLKGFVYIGY